MGHSSHHADFHLTEYVASAAAYASRWYGVPIGLGPAEQQFP
jgi:hypothetical protein